MEAQNTKLDRCLLAAPIQTSHGTLSPRDSPSKRPRLTAYVLYIYAVHLSAARCESVKISSFTEAAELR